MIVDLKQTYLDRCCRGILKQNRDLEEPSRVFNPISTSDHKVSICVSVSIRQYIMIREYRIMNIECQLWVRV